MLHDPQRIQTMINTWLVENDGPRRFAPSDSADFVATQLWLVQHGYSLKAWRGKFALGRIGEKREPMRWREVLELVDTLRLARGLEPIVPQAPRKETSNVDL